MSIVLCGFPLKYGFIIVQVNIPEMRALRHGPSYRFVHVELCAKLPLK